MSKSLADEVIRILRIAIDDRPAIILNLNLLWVEMSGEERRSLARHPQAFTVIECGARLEDPEILQESDCPEVMLAEIESLDFWLTAARNHAEDSGEWEHEIGDLEDLVTACSETIGAERTLKAIGVDAIEAKDRYGL